MKDELLFYNEYEKFYAMAKESKCFKKFCEAVYGVDLSQDGFSDINQINLILEYTTKTNDLNILDIGCGNGKMLKYLQLRIGGHIYGFDFSENAIHEARADNVSKSDFRIGVIGEIDYPPKMFDLIISMDTIYFVNDIYKFVRQIYNWLKDDGIIFIGYQEGDIMTKTRNSETTVLAKAIKENNFKYDVINYTQHTYDLLRHKRKTAIDFKDSFDQESLQEFYSLLLNQTNCITVPYDEYIKHNARYIYIIRKAITK